jgi:predicted patatin/cPLA2 family phospholipase
MQVVMADESRGGKGASAINTLKITGNMDQVLTALNIMFQLFSTATGRHALHICQYVCTVTVSRLKSMRLYTRTSAYVQSVCHIIYIGLSASTRNLAFN